MAANYHVSDDSQEDFDLDHNDIDFKDDPGADEHGSGGQASDPNAASGIEGLYGANDTHQPHLPSPHPQDSAPSGAAVDHSRFEARLRTFSNHDTPTDVVASKIDIWYNQAPITVTITEVSDDENEDEDDDAGGTVRIIRDITGVLLSFPFPPGDTSSEDGLTSNGVFSDTSLAASTPATSPDEMDED